ncbi:hypothetical protein Tco_0778989 [Tanacetum coccineum]
MHHSSSTDDLNLDCRNKGGLFRTIHCGGGVRTLEVHNEKERIASFSTLLVETKLYPWFKCVPCSSKDQERYSGDSVAKNKHVKLHDNEVLLLLTCRLRLCNYPIVASGKAFDFIQRARAVRVNEGKNKQLQTKTQPDRNCPVLSREAISMKGRNLHRGLSVVDSYKLLKEERYVRFYSVSSCFELYCLNVHCRDRVGPNKNDVLGRCMLLLQYVERRLDHKAINIMQFNLEKHVMMVEERKRKWQIRSSVLVNGSLTSEFWIKRGLCQCDLLSPFLFIIIMEGLQIILQNAVCSGLIQWNRQDMDNIIRVLQVFFLASGLKINVSKSNVFGIGVSSQDIEDMARDAGCGSGSVPFSYLGLPIGANMHLTANWQPLIDGFGLKFRMES